MIGRAIGELTQFVDVEETDFCSAAFVAVADNCDGIAGDQHLVIPGVAWIDVWTKSSDSGNWSQCASADCDGEETTASQDHEVIAVQFDNATLVDASVLYVGNRLVVFRFLLGIGTLGGCGLRCLVRG